MTSRVEPVLVALALAGACAPTILIGRDRGDEGDSVSGDAGAPATGGGASETPDTGGAAPFQWSWDFENGALDDPSMRARARTGGTGDLIVDSSLAHGGTFALRSTVASGEDQALLLLEVPPSFVVTFWVYFPADHFTYNWVLLKIRSLETLPESRDVFDVDVATLDDGTYQLLLWEHGTGEITRASTSISAETWTELSLTFTASSESEGSLSVAQDGQTVIETGPRTTIAPEEASTLALGATAEFIDPFPASIWFDDIVVAALGSP